MKSQVEIGHSQPPVGIPGATRTHVEQAFTSLGQYFSAVDEAQTGLLSGLRRLGQNHGHQVIAASRQPRTFDRRILNKFNRMSVLFYRLNFKKTRQFEDQKARSITLDFEINRDLCVEFLRRFYLGIDDVTPHENWILR